MFINLVSYSPIAMKGGRSDLYMLVFIVGLALMAPGASAALSLSASQLDFGSSSQEKLDSNKNSISLEKTVTLSTSSIYTNMQLTVNAESNAQGAITTSSIPTDLNESSQVQLTINVTIPKDFDAVDDELKEKRFDIGS